MPGMISTPDFNKNDIQGWNTRLIFSQNVPSYVDLTSTNYFDAISHSYIRGTLGAFPANYWSQGRMLRLKASLTYGNFGKLDMSTSVTDGTNEVRARSDNGGTHDFANGNYPSNVPISLELMYVKSDNVGLGISGFYQYEWGSYDIGGPNSRVVYVPINYVYDNVVDFTQPTNILLYINDGGVEVNWMTIEELG